MYPELQLLIDGEWLSHAERPGEAVINPATGRPIGDLPHATQADLDRALAAAERAFADWRRRTPLERSGILRRGAGLIRERLEAIALILTLEQGKSLTESRGELLHSADLLDWCAEEGRRAYGRIIPSRNPGVRQMVVHEPVGVAVAFTPWNFPALTPVRKIGAALAAGCTIVLKAAEETPGTAVAIARALQDAGLPPGALNLVFGNPADISARLIASPISRKVTFTGSIPVGKLLMRQAVDGMKRTSMELGGHSPVLVFDDVDVDAVAAAAAASKFRNAGQVCISPTRFYVQDAVFDRFADRFTAAAKALRVGDGRDDGVAMGPLANPRRIETMERFVADARARGGEVRTGGQRLGNEGYFFAPTVITDVPDDSLIMTEEPFGPVAPIVRFSDFDEVIARANSLHFGLAAYAFARSNKTVMAVGEALKAGMVGVNSFAVTTPETPFGGVKQSGHGQEGAIEGLQAYLDVKLIAQSA
jgi:succinate-semialdehyde dehydrogenase/glutarate-semialdehyde dehydrogenase